MIGIFSQLYQMIVLQEQFFKTQFLCVSIYSSRTTCTENNKHELIRTLALGTYKATKVTLVFMELQVGAKQFST